MSKHTPGPWTISGERILAGSNESRDICAINKSGLSFVNKRGSRSYLQDEDVRNARLIAAAPDMLAALTKMVAYFEADIEGFDEADEKYRAFQTARAAIAKAEGAP